MRRYLITATLILVFACSPNKVPKGILTDKEITPILVDIHLAEGIYSQRYVQKITRDNYQEDLYLSVIKKYKVDQKVLEASILYYGKYPEKYKPIYDEVLNRLNELEVKARAKDSIQRLKR
jgi:hypothetical protein